MTAVAGDNFWGRWCSPSTARHHARSLGPVLLTSIGFGLAGCVPITFDCGGPEYRWATTTARMGDSADASKADTFVDVSEQRGGGQPATHSVSINVEASPTRSTVLPLPGLFGHVTSARLERADGSLILQLPLHTESNAVGLIAITVVEGTTQSVFDTIRSELLANHVYVKLLVDDSVPSMTRAAATVTEAHDWAKQGCQ